MNSTAKHVLDSVFAILSMIGIFITNLATFLAAIASLVWYGIRIYEWYKEKKNVNIGNN